MNKWQIPGRFERSVSFEKARYEQHFEQDHLKRIPVRVFRGMHAVIIRPGAAGRIQQLCTTRRRQCEYAKWLYRSQRPFGGHHCKNV